MNHRKIRRRLSPFFEAKGKAPERILDVGCGSGQHLDVFKRLFFSAETLGVEPSVEAARRARERGHVVSAERFEDSTLPERSFNLIHSYHVIEHVAHPRLFMENALRLLADDGLILIETPSTKGLDFALFKRKHWGGYHAPRHWTLFRRKSLQMPVERCGGVVRASGACTSS
ncbi:class I SAM-dependent methyltransferase, partial [Candidatus Bipolaricaulota bacterium]|nr:class I SAM-dependent methyltransferase [Candidatus Bipolaricaulota bacterium]